MGMLLSIPMLIVGGILIVLAVRRGAPKPARGHSLIHFEKTSRDRPATAQRDQGADQILRPHAGLAIHGIVPDASALRLLRLARSIGREGDFTTAPEVSQMFGELLGLWTASVWKQMGSPQFLRLIEIGPGRGTMMADALRALRVLPPLYQALQRSSGRGQSGAARAAECDAVGRAQQSPGTTASTTCLRDRASSSPTNISTCCRSTRW